MVLLIVAGTLTTLNKQWWGNFKGIDKDVFKTRPTANDVILVNCRGRIWTRTKFQSSKWTLYKCLLQWIINTIFWLFSGFSSE